MQARYKKIDMYSYTTISKQTSTKSLNEHHRHSDLFRFPTEKSTHIMIVGKNVD